MVYVSRDDVSPRSFSALFSVRRYPSERALELRGFAEEKALEIRIEATPKFQGTDKRQTGRDVPFFPCQAVCKCFHITPCQIGLALTLTDSELPS